jgi:hypothetical protein
MKGSHTHNSDNKLRQIFWNAGARVRAGARVTSELGVKVWVWNKDRVRVGYATGSASTTLCIHPTYENREK